MTRISKLAAGMAALSVLAAGSAQAATWLITYQSSTGEPFEASLEVTASDTLNAVGGFDVTAITGHVDADAITGPVANPGQPFASYSADGLFIFDNVIWPTGAPVLSNPGLLFAGASGDEYNLFSDDATTYELYRAQPGAGYLANSVGTISFAEAGPLVDAAGAIPEPETWGMMILGFGMAGAILRRRRAQLAA